MHGTTHTGTHTIPSDRDGAGGEEKGGEEGGQEHLERLRGLPSSAPLYSVPLPSVTRSSTCTNPEEEGRGTSGVGMTRRGHCASCCLHPDPLRSNNPNHQVQNKQHAEEKMGDKQHAEEMMGAACYGRIEKGRLRDDMLHGGGSGRAPLTCSIESFFFLSAERVRFRRVAQFF